jgi:hypothetical protein
MSHETKSEHETRGQIFELLSADEMARVNGAKGVPRLADGDEYIDLAAPDNGVRCVHGTMQRPMGQVLPQSAVSVETWAKIAGRFGRRFAPQKAK